MTDATNEDRRNRGEQIVTEYMEAHGDDEESTVLTYIFADLMHYCAREKIDFYRAWSMAQMHFEAER